MAPGSAGDECDKGGKAAAGEAAGTQGCSSRSCAAECPAERPVEPGMGTHTWHGAKTKG